MKTWKGCYKGLIIEPRMQQYFLHKIQLQKSAPFSKEKLEMYEHYGYLQRIQPIEQLAKNRFRCGRCHNEQNFVTFQCARCQKLCRYCRHCINMGRISSCTTLLTWTGPIRKLKKRHLFAWSGQFTPLQQRAAQELQQSLLTGKPHLVHAVCGAGKTEILFPAIHALLERGDVVALATPRTDVVLELVPRLQAVLPKTNIHALYGDAPKQLGVAELVVTTTHQLYKFQEAFDAMIVDEADAFPYTFDETLQRAVEKAKKPNAPIATVTATPTRAQITKALQQGGYSFIARRYHGHPLPVPRIESIYGYAKQISRKQQLPKKLRAWTIQQLEMNKPFFIFFPSIALMEAAYPLFQQLHEDILSVHAEDPERKEKVMQLRKEEIRGLLTTTILERGVTIPNVQVAVVGAEQKIFTDSALIQIAGRVGRHKDFVTGDVVLFHHGISAEMDSAIRQIQQLNAVPVTDSGQIKEVPNRVH